MPWSIVLGQQIKPRIYYQACPFKFLHEAALKTSSVTQNFGKDTVTTQYYGSNEFVTTHCYEAWSSITTYYYGSNETITTYYYGWVIGSNGFITTYYSLGQLADEDGTGGDNGKQIGRI